MEATTDDTLLVLGRQPALGLAELESLYGADKVRLAGASAAVVKVDPCRLAFGRLGGSLKFCKILTVQPTTNWKDLEKFLVQVAPGHSQRMPAGKMRLGLSAYGLKVSPARLTATGLTLKKAIRKTGRPVRLVPNKELALNSAQVIHNHLVSSNGWELVFVKDGDQTIIAQNIGEQNIADYTIRDRMRPKRDPRVGMLPPKLAQIIINLAAGRLPEDKLSSICEIPAGESVPRPHLGRTVLDPFCGTGVILQEAALMGYDVHGTDLEPRMIDYSKQNLEWLGKNYAVSSPSKLAAGDATSFSWNVPPDFIASETYLGRPFTSLPDREMLAKTASECNLIAKKFLQNIHGQLRPGTRLCLAVPAWQTAPDRFQHLPLIDQIGDLGYNRLSFARTRDKSLVYYREKQIVARELLVLIRK